MQLAILSPPWAYSFILSKPSWIRYRSQVNGNLFSLFSLKLMGKFTIYPNQTLTVLGRAKDSMGSACRNLSLSFTTAPGSWPLGLHTPQPLSYSPHVPHISAKVPYSWPAAPTDTHSLSPIYLYWCTSSMTCIVQGQIQNGQYEIFLRAHRGTHCLNIPVRPKA